jgi:transcriptional regulator with XRE-family HTH domain
VSTAIAGRVQELERLAKLTHEDVARIVGTTSRTVSRWTKGTASPQRVARQRLVELAYVAEELTKVLKPEERNVWIFSPNRLLDHDSPADRISQGDYRSVVSLIEALADGVVV